MEASSPNNNLPFQGAVSSLENGQMQYMHNEESEDNVEIDEPNSQAIVLGDNSIALTDSKFGKVQVKSYEIGAILGVAVRGSKEEVKLIVHSCFLVIK